MSRLSAAAQEGGPVEKAWEATGKGELARARGKNDPRLWRKAAEHWDAISRPYYSALVRFREAEAAIESADRSAAASAATAALETAQRLGAGWLTEEVEGLMHRAPRLLRSQRAAHTRRSWPDRGGSSRGRPRPTADAGRGRARRHLRGVHRRRRRTRAARPARRRGDRVRVLAAPQAPDRLRPR